ncbi:DUF6268 family outer membrane beta-barrel protein [Winogradskyella jejuensis]|uniref:DUF6268 domain-containing protein n=1 Tax=Winogradskyella jejuensis TaxID=1089305 RepID=A0A1M5JYS7_9FLAO|nr:DUF6268 family outer membrane beta-barrel protein [Winogradskyella jejuensis]SHG45668.1 hypothetical protein SAMN05444148_0181 [Winogradskyella jejuensis]
MQLKSDFRYSLFVFIICVFACNNATAQLTDLARLEYSFIPSSNSEDQYTRLRALLNYPIKVGEENYLVVGAEYNRILLNLEEDYPFNTEELSALNIIDLNLGYTFKTGENTRLGFKINPRIASTLNGTVTMDDVFLNGGVFYIKDRTKADDLKRPYRLVLGLTYNTTAGIPFPLPFVNYFRRINKNWSFSAGVPKSNLKYYFNDSSILQLFTSLDGYFANLQSPIVINGKEASNISLSVAVGGLGYEYCFTDNLVAYLYSGYTFRLNNILRNEDRDNIFQLNQRNAFYLRTGIKFKI